MRYLEPFLAAIEELGTEGRDFQKTAEVFDLVATERRDLYHRSLFACRGKKSIEIERLVKETLVVLKELQEAGKIDPEFELPTFGSLRFNHTTGYLHAGHGYRHRKLFQ